MSLIHALVARGPVILAEHASGQRDFSAAAEKILSRIPPNNSKLTYVWEDLLIHYISTSTATYLVVADDSVGRRMPFAFLADVQRRFEDRYSPEQIGDALAYGMQGEFGGVLGEMMDQYTHDTSSDPLKQAREDLGNVKDIMVKNVEQILSRGERIDLLVDRTNDMSSQAFAFRKRSTVLRRQMWYKNVRIMVLTGFVILLLLYIFIASFCGAGLNQCRG